MFRDRLARILDGVFFAFVGLAFVIGISGGFRIGRDWYRLSATDPGQALLIALVAIGVRHLLVRRPSLRSRLTARRIRRAASGAAEAPLARPTGREWGIACLVMAATTAWLLRDQIWSITGMPDRGDPLFSMWRLAWVAHQIVTDPARLFDANIFHPATNTFAYSDATLLPGLLSAPLLWAGMPLAVVHGLLFVASFLAAGLTMFALARAVTGQLVPGLLAGVLFGFYPYRFSTYSHIEMQGIFLMPLALLALLRLLQGGRLRDGILLGVWVAMEILWSMYLGAYLAVGLGVFTLVRWGAGHFDLRQRWRPLVAAGLVTAAVALPYSRPYWAARNVVGERPRDETRSFSAELVDMVSINEVNILYGPVLHRHVNAERHLFPGGTATVLAAVALVPPVGPMAAAAGAGLLVAFDAALGVNGATFNWLYERAPAFRAFRVPARFGMLMGVFITLLAALGLVRLVRRLPPRLVQPVAWLVLGFAAFELRPRLELTPTATTPPPIYADLPDDGSAVIVDVPLPADDGEYWVDPAYLYYSTFHWRRLVNGYSGFMPVWYPRLQVASREFPSDESMDVFRDRGAEFLVVHEEFYPPDRYREVTDALSTRSDLQLISTRPSPEGESRLYRVLPRPR